MHSRLSMRIARMLAVALVAMALALSRGYLPAAATPAFADIGGIKVLICSVADGSGAPEGHDKSVRTCDQCLACSPAGLEPPSVAAAIAPATAGVALRARSQAGRQRLAQQGWQPIRGPPLPG